MSETNFEKLQIYQLAEQLAGHIWKVVGGWDYFAKDTLGKQWVRAADSISANIAEGNGRGSAIDNRKFHRQARGSLYETKCFLGKAQARKLLSDEEVGTLNPLINELIPKLNAYLRSISNTIESQKSKPGIRP